MDQPYYLRKLVLFRGVRKAEVVMLARGLNVPK